MRRRDGPWAFSCVSSHTPPCCDVATASAAAAVVTAAAVAVALAATAPGGVSSGAAVSPPWSVSAIVSASYSRGCSIVSKQLDRSVEQKCNATSAAPAAAPRRMPTNRRHSSWTSRSPNSEVPLAWGPLPPRAAAAPAMASRSLCRARCPPPPSPPSPPHRPPHACLRATARRPAAARRCAICTARCWIPGCRSLRVARVRRVGSRRKTHVVSRPRYDRRRRRSARPDARTVAASGGGRTRRIDRLSRRSTSRRARAQSQRAQYCSTPEPPCSSPT